MLCQSLCAYAVCTQIPRFLIMSLPVFGRPSRDVRRSCSRVINAIVSIPSNCRSHANRRLPAVARDDDDDDSNYYYCSSATINAIIIYQSYGQARVTTRHLCACVSDALRIVRRSRLAVITRRIIT